ncbi:MAG: hypothetical protein OEV36_08630, partial [Myxococcales bacterium]|nr:hypothetical protein [Myxococcales bacterium]
TRSVLAHADLTRWSAYDWTRLGGNPGMPTMMAATVLAIEGLPFVSVHVQDREIPSIIMSGVLGLVMAFIAHGRMPRTAIR